MTTPIAMAFLPLVDCAVLAVAKTQGFAEEQGLDLTLVRDVSWATIRDRLVYGQVQAAHLLAPLAVAVTLGLSQQPASLIAPFKLGLNGNALTLAPDLARAIHTDPSARIADPGAAAKGFAEAIIGRARPPVLGVVHRFSSHALTLRYWLAYGGIDPDRDVTLRVLPPPLMGEALAAGEIDGFMVGEPWSSVAVDRGAGEIAAVGVRLWQRGVEKVLSLRQSWAEANPETVDSLLKALDRAAAWCDRPENRPALAELLARPEFVGVDAAIIARTLSGEIVPARGADPVAVPDFLLFHREAANFPWRSQGSWIYAQMVRWGYLAASPEAEAASAQVFRSDLYRRALAGGTTPMPGASAKVEGALRQPLGVGSDRGTLTLGADRFFDERVFDPADIPGYLAGFTHT